MGATAETQAPPIMQGRELPIEPSVEAVPKGYEYTHADGTVHYAESVQQARSQCKEFLGKVSLEEATIILEVQALGKQVIKEEQAREQKKPPEPEKIKPEQKTTETVKPDKHAAEPKSEPLPTLEPKPSAIKRTMSEPQPANPLAVHQAELVRQQREVLDEGNDKAEPTNDNLLMRQQTKTDAVKSLQPEPKIAEKTVPLTKAPKDVIFQEAITELPVNVDERDSVTVPVAETIEMTKTVGETIDMDAAVAEAETDVIDIDPTTEMDEANEPYHTLENNDEASSSDIISDNGINMDEGLELLFDPETIETYEQLVALITAAINKSETSETLETEDNAAKGLKPEIDREIEAILDFETFVATRPSSKEGVTLEVIQEQANGHPLEQTLIRLVGFLSENPEVLAQNKQLEILHEIKTAMPACYVAGETGETKQQITPELVEKLLILLRTLGYQNPRETLVSFVGKYDLTFLLQALEYVCQLNNDNNRQEFPVSSSVTVTANNNSVQLLRLGKLLFGLIGKVIFEPVI